jgi:nitrogen fixation protein FixH
MDKKAGRKWPWIIALSTLGVIAMSVETIRIAINNPVEQSDYGMQNYHQYDANVNEIIEAKIAFDKAYTISFQTPQITAKDAVISYAIQDSAGNPINDANLTVVLTRPDTTKNDIVLSNPTVENGRYTFSPVDLPKIGRWDIMAKVSVQNLQRYYNLKADTRNPNISEF